MKCLRCQTEMNQYSVYDKIRLRGVETNTKYETGHTVQSEYAPQSAYVCYNCGCIEFSKNQCDN